MTETRLTLAEVIREAMDARLADVRVALPAQVVAFDPALQLVDVQPLLVNVLVAEDGEVPEPLPVIPGVPLMFPRAGGFFLTFPVIPGDTVLLVCNDRSIDEWRSLGTQSLPADLRMHSLSDAVAIPGLYAGTAPLPVADVSALGAFLGKAGGPGVHCTPAAVELGGSVAVPPLAFVALAPKTESRLAALEAFALGHTHPFVAVVAGGVPAITAVAPGAPVSPGPVAATKVKGI